MDFRSAQSIEFCERVSPRWLQISPTATRCAERPRRSCCASAPRPWATRSRSAPSTSGYTASAAGADYARMVGQLALALDRLGLKSGERIAIMGDPCEEWMICDLAAQSLGGIVYGIYPTASASEVEFQMRDGGAVVFVAQDQEYVDKILPMADRLPALRHIVVIDDSAMFGYEHSKIRRYRDLLAAETDARPRRVPDDGGARQTGAAGVHRLYLGHHRQSQGRAGHPRQAPRRHRQCRRALSDACATRSTAPSSTCRCAISWAATWPSPCR